VSNAARYNEKYLTYAKKLTCVPISSLHGTITEERIKRTTDSRDPLAQKIWSESLSVKSFLKEDRWKAFLRQVSYKAE